MMRRRDADGGENAMLPRRQSVTCLYLTTGRHLLRSGTQHGESTAVDASDRRSFVTAPRSGVHSCVTTCFADSFGTWGRLRVC
jgi:hypothetical protein